MIFGEFVKKVNKYTSLHNIPRTAQLICMKFCIGELYKYLSTHSKFG
jgi:hypothetical protein